MNDIIAIIKPLFEKINVKFEVLQEKHIDDDKFYPGYIYINNWMNLTDEQNKFINDNIANILYKNDWEILFDFSNSSVEELKKEYFPIYE